MPLGRAKPKVRFDDKAQWLRFEHAGLAALFNFGETSRRIPLPSGLWDLALASGSAEDAAHPEEMSGAMNLPAQGIMILRKRS